MKKILILISIILIFNNSDLFSQITKQINIKNFTELQLEGSSTFIIIQSNKNRLEVEIDNEDVLNYIEIKNVKNSLIINTTNKNKDVTNICSKARFKIYVTNLKSISLEGAGKILAEQKIKTKKLSVLLKGSGNININVDCNSFEGIMKGSSYLRVKGKTKDCEITVNGVGTINSEKLISENTSITVKGVGHAEVNATKTLNATINGVGSIKYSGNPKNKNFNKNGLGTIKKIN